MTEFGQRDGGRYAPWTVPAGRGRVRRLVGRDRLLATMLVTRGLLFAVALAAAL